MGTKYIIATESKLSYQQKKQSIIPPKSNLEEGMSLLGLLTKCRQGVAYRDVGDPNAAALPERVSPAWMTTSP